MIYTQKIKIGQIKHLINYQGQKIKMRKWRKKGKISGKYLVEKLWQVKNYFLYISATNNRKLIILSQNKRQKQKNKKNI